MPEMRQVYSSSVSEIGYSPETRELLVKWSRGGKTSVYKGVAPEVAENVMNAPSIGQALREGIQQGHEHSYLGGTDGSAE